MPRSLRFLEERYCPVLGRNAAIEVTEAAPAGTVFHCLHRRECRGRQPERCACKHTA